MTFDLFRLFFYNIAVIWKLKLALFDKHKLLIKISITTNFKAV